LNDWGRVLDGQRRYFRSGATLPLAFRQGQLGKLDRLLKENETPIARALAADLGKPTLEAYAAETGFLRSEIRFALAHLAHWVTPERVPSPLALFPASSRIEREPLGVVLVIAPWNFPIQLTLGPWIAALAAGNCAILKPSEVAPHSSKLLCQLLEENFPEELVAVAPGGPETSRALLQLRFDRILFTGGLAVAREVALAAAKTLSPLTLELGGKNPVVLDTDCDLALAGRRISWAKFLNAGQSCVAPDYVLVPEERRAELIGRIAENVRRSFGEDPRRSPDYARIVAPHHYDRMEALVQHGRIALGGDRDRDSLYFAPTVMEEVPPGSPPLEEEIFGPILPIVSYRDPEEAIAFASRHPDPLALYLFSNRKDFQRRILRAIPSGGAAVNDLVLQFMNPRLPFGGRGSSGVGEYHGRFGFELFSHKRAIVQGARFLDIPLRYPPYRGKLGWPKRILG
jgi:acyl-CoA reductase-like NAD-dependent aldehyde dehydrogenase